MRNMLLKRAWPVLAACALFITAAHAQTYTFTNAGATGQYGPTQAQVNTAYTGTPLAGQVLVSGGIQYWIVPQTGLYSIEATGAKGYGTYGGRGAYMSGEFILNAGDTLKILVGQKGAPPVGSGTNQYGGGGGSFLTYFNNTPILIAGGGGGSWASSHNATTDASTGTSGNTAANGPTNGAGGNNGSGGADGGIAGGGGGLLGDGGDVSGGKAFINGGAGGRAATNGGEGGFGGGGGANSWDNRRGGGGGGYSGGGGAGSTTTGFPEGGGGGSYNIGMNQTNMAGVGTGDGIIVIKVLSSGATNDVGVISIDSPNVYCAGIHNVVATIQNFGKNVVDSVTLNWSLNGVTQTPFKYIGTIDTIGGTGGPTRQVTVGSFNFTSAAYTVKIWSSNPNGGNDTVNTNDTLTRVKQANLPAPGGLKALTLNPYNATLAWSGGSVSNTWAYVNATSAITPTGPGTVVAHDSVFLTGLNERTTYYFYVREICQTGDSSTWAGPFVYRTPCATILNGNYTLNPALPASATNFRTFADAVLSLTECGVSGPVNIQVASGTFNERIEITEIPGASSANLIRFVGAGRTTTILSNAGTSTANFVTLMFDGADFVEFRDMTIRGTGASNGIGVMFINKADSNALRNVNVTVNTTATGATVTGITFSGSKTSASTYADNGNYNHIDSVTVTGGYYGIRLNGGSTTVPIVGNKITNTTIRDHYYYGIYAYYNSQLVVDNCYMENTRNTANADGLYTIYMGNPRFTNNTIISGDYALYMSNLNTAYYDANLVSEVSNNKIVSTADYGVYASGAGNFRFVHNSVSVSSGYALYFTGGSNVRMFNNHIQNYRTTANSYAMYATCGFDSLDYNNYWTLGTGIMFNFQGTTYNDFAAYQGVATGLGFDVNSYNQDPGFLSPTNLALDQSIINLRGKFAGWYYDIDGNERCEFAPSLGADESYFATPSPDAILVQEDSIFVSSPAKFYSAFTPIANVLLDYTWYVDNAVVSKERNYRHVFGATGNYEVKLRVRSCTGVDRDSVMVNVINPSGIPNTDFTASKLVVDVLEPSQLSDLSDHGATQWEWTAEPSYDAIFSDAFISDPQVMFLSPGEYKICLTTWNNLGQGNMLCKTAYIKVNDDASLCSATESTLPAGRLTDEGGANGNYTANSNCSFLIHPCAGEVTLRFTQWLLSDADDKLSVYDGTDNSGTLIGTFNGNSNLPGGTNGLVASSGKMFIEWSTSPAGQTAGFVAYWTSTPDPNTPKPVANFVTQDSVFIGQVASFVSTSAGDGLSYQWDFDVPFLQAGIDGGKKESDRYQWNTPGTYPVALMVYNCGGGDTLQKQITVYAPVSVPVVGFTASRTKVPVLSTITLFDSSLQGGTSWGWKITPEVTVNMIGLPTDKDLKVSFLKSGQYTIQLKVTNSVGSDSLVKTAYIDVFDYCSPVVGSASSDVAISRVKFGTIDNASGSGAETYTSYVDLLPAVDLALRDSFDIRIERQSTVDPMSRKVWVDWNNDGDFNDAGEEVAFEASAKSMNYTARIGVPSTANLGFTTLRVGVSYGQDANKPCGINPTGEFEDYPVRILVDKQAPVITLMGMDTVWVEQGYSYTDAGAVAMDNVDGNLTPVMTTLNPVDTAMAGVYTVRYNVMDNDGNQATERVRVVVVTPDVTKPVITLTGPASVAVTAMTNYTDSGATASDYYLKDLTPQLQFGDNVDLNNLGTYYYWYTVADAAGNKDSVAREVVVVDDVAPVLQLAGANPLVMEVHTAINEPGYTVGDNYYSTVLVEIDSSMVNKHIIGVYPMTYTVTDGSGNVTMVTRMVSVEDHTLPLLILTGADTVVVDVFNTYIEQGVQVTDNYCSALTWSVNQKPNTSVLGEYTLVYTSVDCNGNAAVPVTRIVRVVDRQAPVLTLNGTAAVSMMRWESFTDPGVTIRDNYYDESTLQTVLQTSGNFDPNWVGYYSICYQVTDPSGNVSAQVCRTIEVLENTTGVQDVNGSAIVLYPNPAPGLVTVDFGSVLTESATVQVYDMTGKRVHSQQASSGSTFMKLNLDLASGTYQVHLVSGKLSKVLSLQITR